MDRWAEASPRSKARLAGVFYLLCILLGVFALFAGGKHVVSGNATATTTNILAHESSYRLGFVAGLLAGSCYIAVAVLFYDIFRPVNRTLSLLAAFFSLAGCTIGALGSLFHFAPVVVLDGAQYSSVFSAEQLQALAYMFLRFHAQAHNISTVFFGFYCVLIGCLIFRSTFLPRVLGALMAIAGLGWLISSFASFLSPPLAKNLSGSLMIASGLGETSLCLWLLVIGVNAPRWKEQANAAASRIPISLC